MSESNGIAVKVRDARKEHGTGSDLVCALDGVSVGIEDGEFFTLLGPSGCGKTTLLRLIAGFETPTAGMMLLRGHNITGDPPNKSLINTVFQSYDLFPHLSVSRAFGSASASPYLANETTNAVNPVIKKEASKMDLHGQIFDAVKTRADTGAGEVS